MELQPFSSVTVHERKRNNQTFRGLPDTGSEMTLIPRHAQDHVVYQSAEGLMKIR